MIYIKVTHEFIFKYFCVHFQLISSQSSFLARRSKSSLKSSKSFDRKSEPRAPPPTSEQRRTSEVKVSHEQQQRRRRGGTPKTPPSARTPPSESAYLIEKMLNSSYEGVEGSSEYELYKEAKHYDLVRKHQSLPESVPDDVSEAGTYTVEPSDEEARQSIDKVFGVGDDHLDHIDPEHAHVLAMRSVSDSLEAEVGSLRSSLHSQANVSTNSIHHE